MAVMNYELKEIRTGFRHRQSHNILHVGTFICLMCLMISSCIFVLNTL